MLRAAKLMMIVGFACFGTAKAEHEAQPLPREVAPVAQSPVSAPEKSEPPLHRGIGVFNRAYWGMSKDDLRAAYPTRKLEQVCDEKGVACLEATAWQKAKDRIVFLFARDQLYRIEICPRLGKLELSCDTGDAEILVDRVSQQLKAAPVFLPKVSEVDVIGRMQLVQHYQWGDEHNRFVVRVGPRPTKSVDLVHFHPGLQAMAEKMLLTRYDCESLRRSMLVESPPECGKKEIHR